MQPAYQDEQGQAYLEFVLVFGLLAALILFVAVAGWFWWSQVAAATAIHDGVYAAAIENGGRQQGLRTTRQLLEAALGPAGADNMQVDIRYYNGQRATWGAVRGDSGLNLPFLGQTWLRVRAASFQRTERFYGGRPEDWE